AVSVCTYCRSVVARKDRSVEDLGKVAALVDTGSPLRIGLPGKYKGTGFRITGRTQMKHEAGGVWNEWYAAFDDGRWGWLAEAQGNLYLTFETARGPVALPDALQLSEEVPGIGEGLVVQEVGMATLISAEGEIPWRPVPESTYGYADLSGPDGKFATVDYSEEQPIVFKGWQTSLAELGIAGEPRTRNKVALARLACKNCGGPLELKAPDQAERIICPNCGGAHDVNADGLSFFKVLKKPDVPLLIPLGSSGTIDGVTYAVAGFMQRSVKFDRKYYWTEYLLYAPEAGFRWLVESDGHWSFVTPVSPGAVAGDGNGANVHYDGRQYRIFQRAEARVEAVLGEFYWKVKQGERVLAADFVKAPYGLSRESTLEGAREVNWSHARYMTPREVEKAFGVDLGGVTGIGPLQPFPGPNLTGPWFVLMGLAILVAIALAATRPNRVVYQERLPLAVSSWETGQDQIHTEGNEASRVFFSKPFELSGKHNVRIEASMDVTNTWVAVLGDLVHEPTGTLESFELPVEHYSGSDSDGSWSEGSQSRRVYLRRPEHAGRYVLRIEPHWSTAGGPAHVKVEAREGVVRFSYLLLALLAITMPAAAVLVWKISFEVTRWQDSAFNPYASVSDSSDDE
ncbi:MAG TPA: DUF4178 domain-containing protein, partial [Thermoanaerobaculia bacterium]